MFGYFGWCKQCRQYDLLVPNDLCPECIKKNDKTKRAKKILNTEK